nr:AP2 domain-containing protein [uncultured Rhodopila sp.]
MNEYIKCGNITKILISAANGPIFTALIDTEDATKAKKHYWTYRHRSDRTSYVQCGHTYGVPRSEKNATTLHRLVMNAGLGEEVDHIHHNTLDNRKAELRKVTHAVNMRNISKDRLPANITYHKKMKKWVVCFRINKKLNGYGNYDRREDAEKRAAELRPIYESFGQMPEPCKPPLPAGSGVRGVYWNKRNHNWNTKVHIGGRNEFGWSRSVNLGTFQKKEDAVAAVEAYREKIKVGLVNA